MHVAVAGMHVGGDDDQPGPDLFADLLHLAAHPCKTFEKRPEIGHEVFNVSRLPQVFLACQVNVLQGFTEQLARLWKFGLQPFGVFDGFGFFQVGAQLPDHQLLVVTLLLDIVVIHKP